MEQPNDRVAFTTTTTTTATTTMTTIYYAKVYQ